MITKTMMGLLHILQNSLFVVAVAVFVAGGLCLLLQIKPAVVMSGSMEPAIPVGSVAFVNLHDTSDIEEGDIIAFERQGKLVTHRVVSIDEEGIHTRGDNNDVEDIGAITEDQVKGRTVFWIPKAGFLVNRLMTKSGIILTFTACTALILSSVLLSGEVLDRNRQRL